MSTAVELRVTNDGKDELVYYLKSVSEASDMISFLSDFWPRAEFLVQPLRH